LTGSVALGNEPGRAGGGESSDGGEVADARALAGRMAVRELELIDFRCFTRLVLRPGGEGITVFSGANGSGKTSVLESIAYLATLRSFRTSSREALVRSGAERGFVRGQLVAGDRPVLIEAQIARAGRSPVLLNRQPISSRRALAEVALVSVFCPDDLALVQGGPLGRRDLLDDAAAALEPSVAAAREQLERAVRQRNALLRQCAGRLSASVQGSFEVWDERIDTAGTAVRAARESLLVKLRPLVERSYRRLAARSGPRDAEIALIYRGSWEGSLRQALEGARVEDVRRGTTSRGPHHDELEIVLDGREARQQASQGEQRCLALALRLGIHELVTVERGLVPLLLLDDVFSELDPQRARALVEALPAGQIFLSTASPLPKDMAVSTTLDVATLAGGSAPAGGLGGA
jgi:DNA replication and repair protein RecF